MEAQQKKESISSGIPSLDLVLDGYRLGDNVVWQVDSLEDYRFFAEPFVQEAIRSSGCCVYLRFASHPPVVPPRPGLVVKEVDPGPGFAFFTAEIHRLIREQAGCRFFILDSLSALVDDWATDELLANFFQVTCPFLGELNTVAYFALLRGRHANSAVARIRDTTQVLVDVYRIDGTMYIHPLKVWDRYSTSMFLPHVVAGDLWQPVFQSGQAAAISATARKHPLHAAKSSLAPWDSVYNRLLQYRERCEATSEQAPEFLALKREACRILIGTDATLNRLAEKYFTLDDLLNVRERMIGSGRIGGKATGMLLARKILQAGLAQREFSRILEPHDSFYIGSDVFFTFLVDNQLFRLRLQLTNNSTITAEEFARVEQEFLAGSFPAHIMEQFRNMLDYFGQAPIIVRSSSLLEDSYGNAFAGKYRSEFCANQGDPETRLKEFLRAVKLVYASTLSPHVLSYRLKRGLGENDEQMAILVQRVAGFPYRHFFFPCLAGVAFSRNLYAWSERIDPSRGLIRLVFGLGTRAVNRVPDDYPRMIAVSHPHIRPEADQKIARYSQHKMDLLDLRANRFMTVPVEEVLQRGDYPRQHYFTSVFREGYLFDPPYVETQPDRGEKYLLTFNRLIGRTPLVKMLGEMLECLEEAYGHPVDTEFTASLDEEGRVSINLLQCRPLWQPGQLAPLDIPQAIPAPSVLFRAFRSVNPGLVEGIRYVIYVDAQGYAGLADDSLRRRLGRLVGDLNRHPRLAGEKILLMGPGRWGSSNLQLGVNTGYADLHNVSVLVEVAFEKAGQLPEVSYGTHFFLDLVESGITYLPVYPDHPRSSFNHAFLLHSPSVLGELLPGNAALEGAVKVIDVPAVSGGMFLRLVADPRSGHAVCYLDLPPGSLREGVQEGAGD